MQSMVLRRTPRFRLALFLRLLLHLLLFLLLLRFLLVLPLQALDLLLRLSHRLEEPLQPRLLRRLQVLLQFAGCAPHSVFTEAFLLDQELHEAVDVGCLPFEIAVRVVGLSDVGLEEQFPRLFVWPVVWDCIFLFGVFLDEVDDTFECVVVTDEFEGSIRANFRDRINIVAAQEDAEVDELDSVSLLQHTVIRLGKCLTCFLSIARPANTRSRCIS